MPWRFSELGHLQLLSIQWLPLVWLFAARLLTERQPGRDAVWLALVLGVQMLSSFYLAYLTLFSTGLIAASILVAYRPPRSAIYRLAGAVAIPSAVVALTGVPYVARFSAYRFTEASAMDFVASPGAILSVLAPPLSLRADLAGIAPVTYHVPLAVLLCAVLALGWWAKPLGETGDRVRRTRVVTLGLAIAVAGALVLMLGRKIQLGDTAIRLPGHWLAQFVPGFSQMRAEFRWGIVLGVAFPVLAGSGVAWGEGRLRCIANDSARAWAKVAAGAGAVTLFALNIQWLQLPARGAWEDAEDVLDAHRALATLAPGPVVEIPWRIHRINTATNGSRYMLASSLHWYPLLNGYTAYVPDTHHFLQRLAQSLPDPRAIENLRRLTGLRWILLHPDRLGRQQRRLWSLAERSGDLRIAVARPDFRIYDVAAEATNESWLAALVTGEPRERTMTGLSRAPVALPSRPGSLRVQVRDEMRYEHGFGLPYFAKVSLTNPSDEAWPGLDIQTEGLVQIRYRFVDDHGAIVREDTAPLDVDLPPRRTSVARALIRPPAVAGRFRVRFDVVQRVGGELRDLGFPATESEVDVSERPLLSKPRGLRGPAEDGDVQDMPRSAR
jgi:hypothetical protein